MRRTNKEGGTHTDGHRLGALELDKVRYLVQVTWKKIISRHSLKNISEILSWNHILAILGVSQDQGSYKVVAGRPKGFFPNPTYYISREEIQTIHRKVPFRVDLRDKLRGETLIVDLIEIRRAPREDTDPPFQ
jgi:hypothetical protein